MHEFVRKQFWSNELWILKSMHWMAWHLHVTKYDRCTFRVTVIANIRGKSVNGLSHWFQWNSLKNASLHKSNWRENRWMTAGATCFTTQSTFPALECGRFYQLVMRGSFPVGRRWISRRTQLMWLESTRIQGHAEAIGRFEGKFLSSCFWNHVEWHVQIEAR